MTGMFEAIEHGDLSALYVIGENPAQSEADQTRARKLLGSLDCLVVQDIFRTKTAELADVVLPASAQDAEAGSTTSANSAVFVRKMSCTTRQSRLPSSVRARVW